MASSFFQRARDRAQEAASQLSASYSQGQQQASTADGETDTTTDSSNSNNKRNSKGGFTYTGGLPHALRSGLASVDPRFESTRSLHVLRGALKGIVIDENALSRETKSAAAKVYKYGQDHAIGRGRLDGVGDHVLEDVTDRLAYILTTIGDLEKQHADSLTQARAHLKKIQTSELELSNRRAQRVKLVKELQTLVTDRMVPGGNQNADELQAQLEQLQREAKTEEESLSKIKRASIQQAFDAQFDAYIQHGEKMALVASYGKLLMQQLPTDKGADFPANNHQNTWEGSVKTAYIRSLVDPALKAYQPHTLVPTLDGFTDDGLHVPRQADDDKATISDAASFRTSHAHELEEDDLYAPASTGHKALATGVTLPAGDIKRSSTGDSAATRSSSVHHRVPPPLQASHGDTKVWDPSTFLAAPSSGRQQTNPYALVLLNQPIADEQKDLFRELWQNAQIRVCADGGGDCLLRAFSTELSSSSLPLPHAVVGDFDSLSTSSRAWYEAREVQLAHRPSQYATDLQKSIQWIEDLEHDKLQRESSSPSELELVIFGGLSGRLDQTAHTLHVLWKLTPGLSSGGGYEDPFADDNQRGGQLKKRKRAWVIGEGSLVCLLPEGSHTVKVTRPTLGKACGILPFGINAGGGEEGDLNEHAARVRTNGLEWNLDPAQPQSLGGYLSTSNHVLPLDLREDGDVYVETDKPIYWSVEIPAYSRLAVGGTHASGSTQGATGTIGGPSGSEAFEDNAPPGPTVAETGVVLPASPSGPGPKTGTLQPRRASNTNRTSFSGPGAPPVPPRPSMQSDTRPDSIGGGGLASPGGHGPVGYTTPAFLPPPVSPSATGASPASSYTSAAPATDDLYSSPAAHATGSHTSTSALPGIGENVASVVHARIRRDGTITRRGKDADFAQAEEEGLPAYTEMA